MPEAEFRLIVCGSPDYDDELSLRTALNRVFDSVPTDVMLAVVCGTDEPSGAERIAGEWAAQMHGQGMPVRLESAGDAAIVEAGGDKGLAGLRSGAKSTRAKACLIWMFQTGIPFEIVVQGAGQGLPEDLIRGGLGTTQ